MPEDGAPHFYVSLRSADRREDVESYVGGILRAHGLEPTVRWVERSRLIEVFLYRDPSEFICAEHEFRLLVDRVRHVVRQLEAGGVYEHVTVDEATGATLLLTDNVGPWQHWVHGLLDKVTLSTMRRGEIGIAPSDDAREIFVDSGSVSIRIGDTDTFCPIALKSPVLIPPGTPFSLKAEGEAKFLCFHLKGFEPDDAEVIELTPDQLEEITEPEPVGADPDEPGPDWLQR